MPGPTLIRGLAFLLMMAFPAMAAPVEKNLTLDSGSGMLAGTLLTPENPKAAILMLAGSGATDRNGNSPPLLNGNSYRLLAEGLAAHGISSLRVDKRGVGESRATMVPETELRIGNYVDDAKAWAAELRKQTGTRCVWLLGHSEGALVAELAAQNARGVCGLILVSGAGRNLADIMRAQFDINPANPPELKQAGAEILSALKQGRTVNDVPPLLMSVFRPSIQPYLISEISLDPAALLKNNTLPVLIMQGDTDIQISMQDAKLLASARPDAKLMILPGVNHMLKTAPLDWAANFATYSNPNLPLAPGVVDAVADFVHDHGS